MGEKVPWYKWRFTLGGILLVLVFSHAAWVVLRDVEGPTYERVGAGGALAFLASLFTLLEWRHRKPPNMWPPKEKDQTEE